MSLDPLAALKAEIGNIPTPSTSYGDIHEVRWTDVTDEKPTKRPIANIDIVYALEGVEQSFTNLSRRLDKQNRAIAKLAKVAGIPNTYNPHEPTLRELWLVAFKTQLEQLTSIAANASSQTLLERKMEEAVTKADMAVKAYIAVREKNPDPVTEAMNRWATERLERDGIESTY